MAKILVEFLAVDTGVGRVLTDIERRLDQLVQKATLGGALSGQVFQKMSSEIQRSRLDQTVKRLAKNFDALDVFVEGNKFVEEIDFEKLASRLSDLDKNSQAYKQTIQSLAADSRMFQMEQERLAGVFADITREMAIQEIAGGSLDRNRRRWAGIALSIDTVAEKTRTVSEIFNRLSFNISFMGFIVQFISFMTVLMLQRITAEIQRVIDKVTDWKQTLIVLGSAIFSANQLLGEGNILAEQFGESFAWVEDNRRELEAFKNIIDGIMAALQVEFVRGLFGEDVGAVFEDLDLEGVKDTIKALGEALRPFIDGMKELFETLARPDVRNALVFLFQAIMSLIGGIVKGIPIAAQFAATLEPVAPIVFRILENVGKLLPAFIMIGTVLSLVGPLFTAFALAILGFGGSLKLVSAIIRFILSPSMESWINLTSIAKESVLLMKTKVVSAFSAIKNALVVAGGAITNAIGNMISGFNKLSTLGKVKVGGGIALAGVGAGLLATGGIEGLLDESAKMEDKLKAVGGVAASSFGAALAISEVVPVLGKFLLIIPLLATGIAVVIAFRQTIIEQFSGIMEFFQSNPILKPLMDTTSNAFNFLQSIFTSGFGSLLGEAEAAHEEFSGGSIITDMWNDANLTTMEGVNRMNMNVEQGLGRLVEMAKDRTTKTSIAFQNMATSIQASSARVVRALDNIVDRLQEIRGMGSISMNVSSNIPRVSPTLIANIQVAINDRVIDEITREVSFRMAEEVGRRFR